MKTAVIDVGSNSVRYALLNERTEIADKELSSTVLADGLFFSGKLSPDAMERTADAIESYCRKAQSSYADEIYIFATEAVRSASNGKEFTDAVYRRTGIAVDVIDGVTEARIGFLGAAPKTCEPVAVFDLGGASCEIICGENGIITYEKSVPIGCVRLRDGADGNREKAENLINSVFADSVPHCNTLIGIGGTATALGSMLHCPYKYDPAVTHKSIVTKKFLQSVATDFFAGYDMRAIYPSLTPARARVIGYGALASLKVMQKLNLKEFTVSERDNIEGYYEYKCNDSYKHL